MGKERAAWAKANEYLTDLMDSDTMQRQDIEGDKRTAFSSAFDEEDSDHEVKALRAALKESEQRLLALEAKFNKFDSFLQAK